MVFQLLMKVLELLVRDLKASMLKTLSQTEEPIENYYSPLKELSNTLVELSCTKRLLTKQQLMERTLQSSYYQKEFFQVSKQTRVLLSFKDLMMKIQPKVLMVQLRDVRNITRKDVDSLNGEQSLKLEMADLHNKLQSKMLTHQQDMLLFAKKMDQFQSLSQKS